MPEESRRGWGGGHGKAAWTLTGGPVGRHGPAGNPQAVPLPFPAPSHAVRGWGGDEAAGCLGSWLCFQPFTRLLSLCSSLLFIPLCLRLL